MSIPAYDPRDHPAQLRATDAQREIVAGQIRDAVDDGRLQLGELDERLGAVYEAKTHEELSAVIGDIVPQRSEPPLPTPPVVSAPQTPVTITVAGGVPVVPGDSDRKILPGFLLCFFLGVFGVHRFYAGKIGSGIAMLVLTITFVGLIVSGIWAFVDLIVLAVGSFRDGDHRRMREWT